MRVAVVGAGYVGLSSGVCLAARGHDVTCVDVMPARVAAINRGEVPFSEPGLPELLAGALSRGTFRATTALEDAVASSEIAFITVGTPASARGIDLTAVTAAARMIGAALRRSPEYRVVVVKSTVVPGSTDTVVREVLEGASGLVAGEFGLCMNPEFLREGAAVHDFMSPDRIVIGRWDERSGRALAALYEGFDCPTVLTSLRNAELIKYASNALLATLVSFSNEMAALCEAVPGADVREVLRGVHLDRRLTPVVDGRPVRPGILEFLWAGSGFGGSCLPKDVNALRAWAREHAVIPHLLDAVMAVNDERPERLVAMAERELGNLDRAAVTVLGLAFKPGTDDLRDSPALALIRLLLGRGALVRAYDPLVRSAPADWELDGRARLCATPEEALAGADLAVVATAWPDFVGWDWGALCRAMRRPVVLDARNVLGEVTWPAGARVLGAGRAAGPAGPQP